MSRRRPSVIAAIVAPPPQAEPPRPSKPGRDVVHTSIYVPTAAYEVLRQIAFTRGRKAKIHDLMLEGIDEVLRRHGHPTVAELAKK